MKIFFVLVIALGFTACSMSGRTVNPREEFTLKKGETARIQGTELKLKMLENGTSQQTAGGDSVFCRVEISYKDKTEEKTLEVGGFAAYDEWNIRLEKVKTGADLSKTSCSFVAAKALG